jgi:hypothetical protein
MMVTADDQQRVLLPVKPGDQFDLQISSGGKMVLTPLAPAGTGTTDFYLASLADRRGMRLATLDESIAPKAAYLIPSLRHQSG